MPETPAAVAILATAAECPDCEPPGPPAVRNDGPVWYVQPVHAPGCPYAAGIISASNHAVRAIAAAGIPNAVVTDDGAIRVYLPGTEQGYRRDHPDIPCNAGVGSPGVSGQRAERDAAAKEVASHGWSVARETAKGYYIMRCACGRHQTTMHKTPSAPDHFRNKVAWMISQCSDQRKEGE
jgi:hypothetical protein